ncbi:MAG: radical SAM protein [Candidatus Omnitrophota bacterium]|nr:radical SAM protein [Candidatus Omnitrophota bacterium]
MILINSSPKDALKIFQPFLPIFVPVGIGCLLAAAKKEGISANYIDEQVEDNILGLADKYVKGMHPPYIFGFSVLTAAFKNALSVSKELKKRYPGSMIIFGGVHPTAMPEEVLSYGYIDVVVRGEGEKSLIDLYKCVREGKSFTHLDNLSFRQNGSIVHNKTTFSLGNLDSYPSFPYHLFACGKKYDLGFVLSSRGCPYECIFCSNRVTTGRRYRYRSAPVIVEELEMLYKQYNKRSILFVDDNFLVNKERIYLLIDEIKKKGLDKKMIFNFQARGDNVNYQILKDLFESGFRSIFFGMETSNEEVMKVIKKNETVAQCVAAAKLAKQIGFHVSATFIYGLPKETYQDRMNCVKLSKELELDMVRYNNATPYPGTELWDIAKKENRLNIKGIYDNFLSVSTFIENPFKKIPFSYVPAGNSEEEIRRDILYSYFSYYFDFMRLKQIFAKPELGVGWFNAGENLLEMLKKLPALIFLGLMIFTKLCQLFYYMVLKKKTRVSFRKFITVFDGLFHPKLSAT